MKFIIALWLGKLINLLVSIIDKSRGSNLAGQWAMKIDRKMVYHFWKKGIDCSKVLFVTGTNGKSTTNNLINHIFKVNGKKVVSNLEGANLIFGIATALIKASTLTGKINTDFFIFETDERFMPIIRAQLPAENVMITNLEKDQVQRNGDPDFIYRKLYQAFGGHQNPAGASGGYQNPAGAVFGEHQNPAGASSFSEHQNPAGASGTVSGSSQSQTDSLAANSASAVKLQGGGTADNASFTAVATEAAAVAAAMDVKEYLPVRTMYLNNEEPRSRSLGSLAGRVVTYGVEKHSESFIKNETYVTMPCPRCRHKISFGPFNTDGMGRFVCTGCGYHSEAHADYEIGEVDFDRKEFDFRAVKFTMPYDMPYMLYNYAAAIAVAEDFGGISPVDAAKAFGSFKNVGGRYEVLKYQGKTIKYMRIKQENPETLQSTLNVIASDKNSKMVILGLYPVADVVPYYTNTFYAFDCDFSRVVTSNVEKYFCFSDPVCYDTANRLLYEGVDPDLISIDPKDDPETILREIDSCETDDIYIITWMHIFQNLQAYVKKEGLDK